MDQYPFEFKIIIAGIDYDDFLDLLIEGGFEEQVESVQCQFEEQMDCL